MDEGGPFELDLLAASLRSGTDELGSFVETLAVKLEDAIPSLVSVQRGRRGLFGPKVVRRMAVSAGDERLELVAGPHDRVETRRARLSGGIVLKTEAVDIDTWMAALTQALSVEAEKNERTRQALERLLLG